MTSVAAPQQPLAAAEVLSMTRPVEAAPPPVPTMPAAPVAAATPMPPPPTSEVIPTVPIIAVPQMAPVGMQAAAVGQVVVAGAVSSPGGSSQKRKGNLPGSPFSPGTTSSVAVPAGSTSMRVATEGGHTTMMLPVKHPFELKHERLIGVISKYQPQNGWGYVTSYMFEGELYFRSERIMTEFQGHPVSEGEAVEFDVQADDNGRPQAVAIKPVLGRKPFECLGQRHRGYVRRFAERWGFLNAAAFDGDLFVHRDNFLPVPDQLMDGQPLLRNGQSVEFDVALDDRGRAVAKQITTHALLRPCDWTGHRLRGYIRSFQGAWGFINSDRFAGDLFVHRDSLLAQCQSAPINIGTVVEFDIERDHHRKGAKNRLVARNVAVLAGETVVQQVQQTGIPGAAMPGAPPMPQQAGMTMDPSAYRVVPPVPLIPGYGAMNPQAPSFASSQASAMYYPQATQPAMAAAYTTPQYPYTQPPYPIQQPMMPPYQSFPPQYGQQPCPVSSPYGQQPVPPQYSLPPQQPLPSPQLMQPQQALPSTVQPIVQSQAVMLQGATVPAQANGGFLGAPPVAPSSSAMPVGEDGQSQGLLHITVHDWEPDQPGQLWVTKGTLVNVSHRAGHGWVYAGTVQPGAEAREPASEGWIPLAVVKRVSLCRVSMDWPAEGNGTLGVLKGEIIAVSKEAERGWVYGERIGVRQPDRPCDGWLPKKILDYLQS